MKVKISKRVKFIFLSVCVFFYAVFSTSARSGLLAGEKNIRYIQTQYFDIIYPESSTASASHLALHADSIYDEICEAYGVDFRRHIPVTISSSSDYFNAYFSIVPFCHIVLLDTLPTEDMLVQNDNILNTFRHELTHAVTMTYSSEEFQKIQNAIGDIYNFQVFPVTGFLAESATVSFESQNGEGRLNDGYYLHTSRQAKLQDAFPSYKDVTGFRDIYPSGSYYTFGGVFAGWLQEKYGMQKYASWWYWCVNGKDKKSGFEFRTYEGYFKNAYGFSLKQAWNEFYEELKVPDCIPNPLEEKGVNALFNNAIGERYALYSTVKTENGYALLYAKESNNGVWLKTFTDDGLAQKDQKLFSKSALQNLSASSDGRFLAVTSLNCNHANYKNEVRVYDLKNRCWVKNVRLNLRDATVVCSENRWYLCGIKVLGQTEVLKVYELMPGKNGKVISFSSVYSKELPRGEMLYSLCDASGTAFTEGYKAYTEAFETSDDGKAYEGALLGGLYKRGLEWTFCSVSGFENENIVWKETKLPFNGMRLRSLRAGFDENKNNVLTFTWCTKENFPRFGILKNYSSDSVEVSLMNEEISGGVYTPFLCGKTLYFTGNFVNDKKAFSRELSLFNTENFKCSSNIKEVEETKEAIASEEEKKVLDSSLPYKKLYNNRGIIIPFSTLYQFDNELSTTATYSVPGITYITGNPWDSEQLYITAGFDALSLSGGVGFSFTGSTSTGMGTPIFSYAFNPNIVFDASGFKQTYDSISLQEQFSLFNHSSIALVEENILFMGRSHTEEDSLRASNWLLEAENLEFSDLLKLFGMNASSDSTSYFTDLWGVKSVFSTIHSVGSGHYEKAGFQFGLQYAGYYLTSFNNFTGGSFYSELTPSVVLRVPRLIPVSCVQGLTYNLPLIIEADYTPSLKKLFSYEAEIVLFAKEIQRGLPLATFVNRLELLADYSGYMFNLNENFEIFKMAEDLSSLSESNLRDSVALKVLFTGGINTGTLVNSPLSFGLSVEYKIHRETGSSPIAISVATSSKF